MRCLCPKGCLEHRKRQLLVTAEPAWKVSSGMLKDGCLLLLREQVLSEHAQEGGLLCRAQPTW